jgi:hypothetical protein
VTGVTGAFARCKVALERLELWTDRFDDTDAEALASARSLARLEHLTIGGLVDKRELTSAGMKTLRARFPKLAPLDVQYDGGSVVDLHLPS